MRLGGSALAIAAMLLTASAASAAPRLVARGEAFGGPALAGDDVVYLSAGPRLDLTRVTPDGTRTVIQRLPGAFQLSDPYDDGFGDFPENFAEVDGSSAGVVASVFTGHSDRAGYLGGRVNLAVGPREGPLATPAGRCYVEYDLTSGSAPRAIARRFCVTPAARRSARVTSSSATSLAVVRRSVPRPGSGSVRIAGHFIAYAARTDAPRSSSTTLTVRRRFTASRSTSRVAGSCSRATASWSLFRGDGWACVEGVAWYSPAEPTAHTLPGCANSLLAVDRDQILIRRK